jgi:hypothetical protein
MMAGGAITWSSKCQATVALSTVEAEYVAMSRCAQQMSWMHSWLDEVKIKHVLPGLIKGDNCGAIALTKNTKDHHKVKHIETWQRTLLQQWPIVNRISQSGTAVMTRIGIQQYKPIVNRILMIGNE